MKSGSPLVEHLVDQTARRLATSFADRIAQGDKQPQLGFDAVTSAHVVRLRNRTDNQLAFTCRQFEEALPLASPKYLEGLR